MKRLRSSQEKLKIVPMDGAETKGAVILSGVQALSARFNNKEVNDLVAGLKGDVGERLRAKTILTASWYPAKWYGELLKAAGDRFSGDVSLARQVGYAAVTADFQGPYRFFIKAVSPQMLLSWGPRTVAQFYRGGKLVVNAESKHADAHYRGWHGFDDFVWHSLAGGTEAALIACGAREPVVNVLHMHQDSAHLYAQWA